MPNFTSRSESDAPSAVLPFLKWPGGKRQLARTIAALVPNRFSRYFEPFLGGGAVFFSIQPEEAVLSDKNIELIEAYCQVRDDLEAVIEKLRKLPNSEEHYYAVRCSSPTSPSGRAARLIYLSNLSFNGIHRVNLKGEFNVPYGYRTHIKPCNRDALTKVHTILQKAKIYSEDFQVVLADARKGDVVYLDPPYTVAHSNNGFVKYNAKIFSWEDQKRLAQTAHELRQRGCIVIVSNADHESIRKLYSSFQVTTVQRHSVMAASDGFRRKITECIFHNGYQKYVS